MKISEEKQNSLIKNIKYIALLGGMLALVLSYFMGYSKLKVSNDELKVEIEGLEARLDDLETKKKNQKMYEEGIETFKKDTENILGKFDAGLSDQRIVVDYQQLSDDLGVTVSAMSFSPASTDYSFGVSADAETTDESGEGASTGMVGCSKDMNVTVTGTYMAVKDFLTKLMDTSGRRRVPSTIGFSFDSAINSVSCSMTVKEYAVVGGERQETEPVIEGYNKGVDNIFFSGGIGVVVQ